MRDSLCIPAGIICAPPGRVVELDSLNLTNRYESVIRGALGPSRQTATGTDHRDVQQCNLHVNSLFSICASCTKYRFLTEWQAPSKAKAVICWWTHSPPRGDPYPSRRAI